MEKDCRGAHAGHPQMARSGVPCPADNKPPCGIGSRWGSMSILADVQKYREILFLGSREAPPLGSEDGGVQAEGRGCSRKGAGGHSGR